jgi:hypothetical protein
MYINFYECNEMELELENFVDSLTRLPRHMRG